jgi:hypothetical protein
MTRPCSDKRAADLPRLEIVLTEIGGAGGGSVPHPRGSGGAEGMRLALDVLEGENFARKNHHGVGPRRARSIFWKAKTSPGLQRRSRPLHGNGKKEARRAWACRSRFTKACASRG